MLKHCPCCHEGFAVVSSQFTTQGNHNMRKIELEMNRAIQNGDNWSNGNTMVTSHNNGMSEVFLHGHHIARVWRFGDDVQVDTETLKDWPTRTTMSRLRALGADVCTRKGVVMLDGQEVA